LSDQLPDCQTNYLITKLQKYRIFTYQDRIRSISQNKNRSRPKRKRFLKSAGWLSTRTGQNEKPAHPDTPRAITMPYKEWKNEPNWLSFTSIE
jgi:hypothetical protein